MIGCFFFFHSVHIDVSQGIKTTNKHRWSTGTAQILEYAKEVVVCLELNLKVEFEI